MKDGFLKAAALSPSLRVADCNYNASQIVSQLQDAAARGVRLAVFPEFCLTGYTCGDLFWQETLLMQAKEELTGKNSKEPITVSGLNHRLNKLINIYNEVITK